MVIDISHHVVFSTIIVTIALLLLAVIDSKMMVELAVKPITEVVVSLSCVLGSSRSRSRSLGLLGGVRSKILLATLIKFFSVLGTLWVHSEITRVLCITERSSLMPLKLMWMSCELSMSLGSLIWVFSSEFLAVHCPA